MDYIPGIVWFLAKAFLVVWLLMWVKWTFPRLRVDQILTLEWKYLMPVALFNLVLMTACVAFGITGHMFTGIAVAVIICLLAVVVISRAVKKAAEAKKQQKLVID